MNGVARGRATRGRGARGRGGRVRGCGGGGRGRGLPVDSAESAAPSVATASVTQSVSVASEASVDASVGLGEGAKAAEVVQPQAADLVVPPYLEMMVLMQRIGTPVFEGGVGPEEGDAWRQRLERNFQTICCPLEYQVELAVHHLNGDTHLWWRSIVGRRAVWTWGEFLAEFNAKYFPREARDRLQMRFLSISQGKRSVHEYDAEFTRLLVPVG
ncbi:unnamed protein product [Microthlaspi erraticum]|uniref:Retrotransposon gag domain-containing protein n=1 Tax=Microthlaspi erraticum TaxID=1685480 RepID=A0A6D2IP48_9BRAS|nr:unnamed protein product [Microthlaspi erraticum]